MNKDTKPTGPEAMQDLKDDVVGVVKMAMENIELKNPKPIATINGYDVYLTLTGVVFKRDGEKALEVTLNQHSLDIGIHGRD